MSLFRRRQSIFQILSELQNYDKNNEQNKKTTLPEQKINAVCAIVCAFLLELFNNSLATHWVTKQA